MGEFGGPDVTPEDERRLEKQLRRVWAVMRDCQWHKLSELAKAANCETQSASARLRDLRKEKFGAHIIVRRRIGGGAFEYRLIPQSSGFSPVERAEA